MILRKFKKEVQYYSAFHGYRIRIKELNFG